MLMVVKGVVAADKFVSTGAIEAQSEGCGDRLRPGVRDVAIGVALSSYAGSCCCVV